CARGGEDFDYW
nr:immunoglobulin heavy chain junction region [Macaca mulatta]MOV35887.1 immunoglobulin heavy chain junction region [Macaca mulatta]MOV35899.1 immunoglobulin heavy chain junction region [Macaca mulatta]MOV35966.1 immunoglobulin heavy chain junction region [Macaca mulatta]MOV36091.1 immunoglobulin heavy chain junction region [Macaca mulatta]